MSAPEAWRDITSELNNISPTFTIADPDNGVGALQFSTAIYRQGAIPSPTVEDLATMVKDFALSKQLGDAISKTTFKGYISFYHSDFQVLDNYFAVWFITDGRNIALATYTS
jgi:hypothetical protein